MTKKTKEWVEWIKDENGNIVTDDLPNNGIEENPHYLPVMWSGVLPTFRCEKCGHCDPDKDEIILHVITHAPEGDRESLLEKLMKE